METATGLLILSTTEYPYYPKYIDCMTSLSKSLIDLLILINILTNLKKEKI